jgi:predicted dehydrogenase
MINAAIVGLGRWGQTLVNSVADSGSIRFTRGVTRTVAKAEAFCAERGMPLGDDYAAALADSEIDAVVLATPHSQHLEQILAAAEAGKHVFCEKPFTLTKADADTALAALAAKGLRAGVGHNRRFAPNTIELKRMLEAGELGETMHIEGNFSANMTRYAGEWRTSRAESPAGGMTSLGVHSIDAFIHLFGRIAEVEVRSKRQVMPYDVDDTTLVLLAFEDGRTGFLSCLAATSMLWSVRAFGDKGWVELRDQDKIECVMADGSHESRAWDGYEYPALATIAAELEAFAADVEGGAPFLIPPDQISHGVAVLEAIIESAEGTGQAVKVA